MDFASYFYTKRTREIAHAIETQVLTRPGYDLATLGPAKAREIIKMGSFDTIASVIKTMREIATKVSSANVETEQTLEELEMDTDLRNEFSDLLARMHSNIKQKSINKIASLNKTIEALNEEVDRVTSEAEEEKKKLLEEIEELKAKNDDLIAKEAEAKAQLAAAEKANNTLAKEVQTISDIAGKLKKEKDEQGQDLLNALQQNNKLVKEINDAIAAKKEAEAEAKAEAEKANDKITALIERASKAETNYEQTQVRLDEAKKAKEEAEAEAKAEIKELKSQLAIVQEQLKTAIEVNKKVDDGSDIAEQKTKQQRKK